MHNSAPSYIWPYQGPAGQYALNSAAGGLTPGNGFGPLNNLRICHGIDQFQGGRNTGTGPVAFGDPVGAAYLDGSYEVTFVHLVQGAGFGTDIVFGNVIISSSATEDLTGDACTSPIFDPLQPGVMHRDAGTLVVADGTFIPGTCGLIGGVEVWLDFSGTPITGPNVFTHSVTGKAVVANVILELQSPSFIVSADPANCPGFGAGNGGNNGGNGGNNGGNGGNNGGTGFGQAQYFIASTTEFVANNPAKPGGVADGNPLLGTGVFPALGADAVANGALSCLRWMSVNAAGTTVTSFPGTQAPLAAFDYQEGVFAGLATRTPALWAARQDGTLDGNGIFGSAGSDWNIGTGDSAELRLIDQAGGAEGWALIPTGSDPTKIDQVQALIAPVDAKALFINFPLFFWTATGAATLVNTPFTWDAIGGPAFVGIETPGDFLVGAQTLIRAGTGPQFLAVNAFTTGFASDPMFSFMLNNVLLTLGTNFNPSWGPTTDSFAGAMQQNGYGTNSYGMSTTGAIPIGPNVNLIGGKFGVNAIGLQIGGSFLLDLTEFSNGLTVQLF
jgi:hypothetical protein